VLRSYISRNHAELKIEDGVLWVHDLGSSNGTLVNGVRINGSHPLSHGDELRFKDVVFQVREDRSQFKSDAMLNQTMFIDKPEGT
jgi:pSer/pThr/pTyr-binding forkhead associated (FHA) protein